MFPNLTPHQVRQIALAHALDFTRHQRTTSVSDEDVVECAAVFERYLRGETVGAV